MTALQATKGKRQKLKAVIGIAAASGAGKTLSAIFLAQGMMKQAYPDATDEQIWDKIGVLDTEHKRSLYYAQTERLGLQIGEFWHVPVDAPYSVERYVEGIDRLKSAGCEIVIVDSASHAWNKEGGLLQVHDEITKASTSKNSYDAWRTVNPIEAKLSDAFFDNDIHIIVTMRSKQEYSMDKDELGKTKITKLGSKPVQRDDMEYEFMTMFNMDQQHMVTVSKDNTGLFDGKAFVITPAHGAILYDWLEIGIDVRAEQKAAAKKAADERQVKISTIAEAEAKYPEVVVMISEFKTLMKADVNRFPDKGLDRALELIAHKIKEINAELEKDKPDPASAEDKSKRVEDKLKAGAGATDAKSVSAKALAKAQAEHAEKQRIAAEAEVAVTAEETKEEVTA